MICYHSPCSPCSLLGLFLWYMQMGRLPFPWIFSFFRIENLRDLQIALLLLEITLCGIYSTCCCEPAFFYQGWGWEEQKDWKVQSPALKLEYDLSNCHTKRSSMALGHSKERDSVFHVTCQYQPFGFIAYPSPASQPFLDLLLFLNLRVLPASGSLLIPFPLWRPTHSSTITSTLIHPESFL